MKRRLKTAKSELECLYWNKTQINHDFRSRNKAGRSYQFEKLVRKGTTSRRPAQDENLYEREE